jgi:hypothetical protein
MKSKLRWLLTEPAPVRTSILRLLGYLNCLSYPQKLQNSLIDRPHYGHCLLQSALLARKLGYPRISAIEFGVAGGNGLVALERHARHVESETGVNVATYGFDTGTGMPTPSDYRDMPYLYQAGYFAMDRDRLAQRLRGSKLILGPISETIPEFVRADDFPPIGFIAFDLDYYTSTMVAFKVLELNEKRLLPRVACYFDDMVGDIDWAYNDYTGELLAIQEFNATHSARKIAPVQGLRFINRNPRVWHEQIFVAHIFEHVDYGRPISWLTELPLDPQA